MSTGLSTSLRSLAREGDAIIGVASQFACIRLAIEFDAADVFVLQFVARHFREEMGP